MPFEYHFLKQIVNLVRRRIEIGVDFVQNDFLLLCQLVFGEGRVKGDVGKEVEAASVVLFQKGGLDTGLLFGGKSVEVTAHIVQAAQDVISLAILCAFEDGVLHKMGEAVFVLQLVTGARFHHQYEVGDFTLFLFMYQTNAIRKDGFSVFVFQHGVKIGLQRYNKSKIWRNK